MSLRLIIAIFRTLRSASFSWPCTQSTLVRYYARWGMATRVYVCICKYLYIYSYIYMPLSL